MDHNYKRVQDMAWHLMLVIPSGYLRCKTFEREDKFKRGIFSALTLPSQLCPPGRAQFSQRCPRVSTFRKQLIKGAEKRVQSSTISLLSWNIHPCSVIKMIYKLTNLQILWAFSPFVIAHLYLWYWLYLGCMHLFLLIYCQFISLINLQNSIKGKVSSCHQL